MEDKYEQKNWNDIDDSLLAAILFGCASGESAHNDLKGDVTGNTYYGQRFVLTKGAAYER